MSLAHQLKGTAPEQGPSSPRAMHPVLLEDPPQQDFWGNFDVSSEQESLGDSYSEASKHGGPLEPPPVCAFQSCGLPSTIQCTCSSILLCSTHYTRHVLENISQVHSKVLLAVAEVISPVKGASGSEGSSADKRVQHLCSMEPPEDEAKQSRLGKSPVLGGEKKLLEWGRRGRGLGFRCISERVGKRPEAGLVFAKRGQSKTGNFGYGDFTGSEEKSPAEVLGGAAQPKSPSDEQPNKREDTHPVSRDKGPESPYQIKIREHSDSESENNVDLAMTPSGKLISGDIEWVEIRKPEPEMISLEEIVLDNPTPVFINESAPPIRKGINSLENQPLGEVTEPRNSDEKRLLEEEIILTEEPVPAMGLGLDDSSSSSESEGVSYIPTFSQSKRVLSKPMSSFSNTGEPLNIEIVQLRSTEPGLPEEILVHASVKEQPGAPPILKTGSSSSLDIETLGREPEEAKPGPVNQAKPVVPPLKLPPKEKFRPPNNQESIEIPPQKLNLSAKYEEHPASFSSSSFSDKEELAFEQPPSFRILSIPTTELTAIVEEPPNQGNALSPPVKAKQLVQNDTVESTGHSVSLQNAHPQVQGPPERPPKISFSPNGDLDWSSNLDPSFQIRQPIIIEVEGTPKDTPKFIIGPEMRVGDSSQAILLHPRIALPMPQEEELPQDIQLNTRSFTDLISEFNSLKIQISQKVWKDSLLNKLCGCMGTRHALSEEIRPIIERLIVFGQMPTDMADPFFAALLSAAVVPLGLDAQEVSRRGPVSYFTKSVYSEQSLSEALSQPGSALTLLFICFLNSFLQSEFCIIFEHSKTNQYPYSFFKILNIITANCVNFLMKKKLNAVLVRPDQALEICFFFYAGLVFMWFDIFNEMPGSAEKPEEVTRRLMSLAGHGPEDIIRIATDYYAKVALRE